MEVRRQNEEGSRVISIEVHNPVAICAHCMPQISKRNKEHKSKCYHSVSIFCSTKRLLPYSIMHVSPQNYIFIFSSLLGCSVMMGTGNQMLRGQSLSSVSFG